MCVIIYKPSGICNPSIQTLNKIHNFNNDGFGFVCDSLSCHTLNFAEFITLLQSVPKSEACLIHFRKATVGERCLNNVHPFHSKGIWMMHNGTLDIKNRNGRTDSEQFFLTVLLPLITSHGIDSKEVIMLLKEFGMQKSSFGLMDKNNIVLSGDLWLLEDNCYYSNIDFIKRYNLDLQLNKLGLFLKNHYLCISKKSNNNMGKEQAKSRNGHSIFEISSLIQKALRRSDTRMALYASAEMLPKYRNYLWKRLLTVSAEDCHDMVTHKIIKLHNDDVCGPTGYRNEPIEKALSILLSARKNRDADYYACNLFNSRNRREFDNGYGIESFDAQSATKNGHNCYYLRNVFNRAIDILDYDNAGYAANEIKVYYPKFCWDMIVNKASTLGYPQLMQEVVALREADRQTNGNNTLLFRSKAIVLMIKAVKYKSVANLVDDIQIDEHVSLKDAETSKQRLPDYVFDCHTYIGKAKGKTKKDFVVAEQACLTPKIKGMFDDASWYRFFYMSEHGFWRDEYTPHPSEARIKEIENNKTPSLFDI